MKLTRYKISNTTKKYKVRISVSTKIDGRRIGTDSTSLGRISNYIRSIQEKHGHSGPWDVTVRYGKHTDVWGDKVLFSNSGTYQTVEEAIGAVEDFCEEELIEYLCKD